ncbi:MAG: translation initiation factor 2 subunit 1 [archaeon GW2011_AR3]|nr:MAG: translation initiation factor 2 subunit 1 [archaeon GW2011_AR3]MBS3109668.1 translation initiation factor IF-2 subunit alpha [Candidatus Woesearchaeota archaeon]
MLYKKQGYPQEDELVLCTVTSVQHHSVFANLDEYGKTGMIHISEVSPGRIRNIRDYVKEGKVVVCKVLRVYLERGNIDLSLRRVTETQKRAKINQIKQMQKAEKIVEHVAKRLGKKTEDLYDFISKKILLKYANLYAFLEDLSENESLVRAFELPADVALALVETVKTRIKPSEVQISGKLSLASFEGNGIEIVKKVLIETRNTDIDRITMSYAGGGKYNLVVKAPDYKTAERILGKAIETAVEGMQKKGGIGEFFRDEK